MLTLCFNAEMRRFAFVDVQNTEGTAHKFGGFSVDWRKLCDYLHKEHRCDKVFFYTGIDNGDVATAREFESLADMPCSVVRAKPVFAFKRKDRTIEINCLKCGEPNVVVVDMGYEKNANCDVELALDGIDHAAPDTEFFVLTGDGDFEALIRKSLLLGVERVYLVSNTTRIKQAGLIQARFSTKLKALLKEFPDRVLFVDLNTWKFKIKRDLAAAA